jgi:hypothetical protein
MGWQLGSCGCVPSIFFLSSQTLARQAPPLEFLPCHTNDAVLVIVNHNGPNSVILLLFTPLMPLLTDTQHVLLQFVRVLQNMAKDLGFFGLVWAVLVLTFSVFLLGATGGAQRAALATGMGRDDQTQPMQAWRMWWFLRTYLQSLGQVVHPRILTTTLFGCGWLWVVAMIHSCSGRQERQLQSSIAYAQSNAAAKLALVDCSHVS